MRSKLFYILIVLSLFASCKRAYDTEGLKIFRYNEAAGITSLDPAYARDLANIWACNQLFDGLVSLDDELNVHPAVARTWDISENGLVYTFTLRGDVYFHPHEAFTDSTGRQVTAYDFEYSFYRLLDPELAAPGSWVFNNVADGGFLALNDSVFQIELRQAFMPFLGLLSMQYCNVVPREVIEFHGKDFRKNPIGCGPFLVKYWKEGVKLVMHKNPVYYEKDEAGNALPYLDAVAVTFLIDKQSAFLQFVQGKIDFLSGIDASYKDELLTPEGKLNHKYNDRVYLVREPYLNTEYLGVMLDPDIESGDDKPLKNKLIRKAISHGFDRVKMMRYLRNNIGIPGTAGIIPAGMPSYDMQAAYGYRYDPQLSASLLKEAGYPAGKGLSPITLTTSAEYLDLCKFIQHELMLLGLDIRINVSPPAAIKEMKAQAKLPFFRASWIADYPDAENYLSLFYSRNFSPAGPNYTHYSNSAFDKLYESSLAIINDSTRYEAYRAMDEMIMEEAAVIILFYDEVLRFISLDVEGLGSNPINLLDLTHVKKNN